MGQKHNIIYKRDQIDEWGEERNRRLSRLSYHWFSFPDNIFGTTINPLTLPTEPLLKCMLTRYTLYLLLPSPHLSLSSECAACPNHLFSHEYSKGYHYWVDTGLPDTCYELKQHRNFRCLTCLYSDRGVPNRRGELIYDLLNSLFYWSVSGIVQRRRITLPIGIGHLSILHLPLI
jgi:hypothetical protein